MSHFADLHIHSHFSDGSSSPEEIVDQAHNAGLHCIALTDHDTLDGITPTMTAGTDRGLEIITGIEVSSQINGRDVHVLGYLFDHNNKDLIKNISDIQAIRQERMKKMIEQLKDLGVGAVEFEEVSSKVKSGAVGRPHLAAVMVKKGWVSNFKQAFDKYLAEGAPAYISQFKQSPSDVISMIKKAGGVAVLAHPMLTQIDELIPQLVKDGLDGLEVYYPNTPEMISRFYQGLARKHGLLMTGGSDAHGEAKKFTYVGRVRIPYQLVEAMKERIQTRG